MFNSISVICLSVWNRAGDGTETVPTALLFVIIFLLRLEYINDKYGFHTLDRTLRLCIEAWEGEQNSMSSNMLRGIAKLVYVYEDKLRDDLFKEKVGKISPKELSRTAKERRAGSLGYAEAMLIAYNHRMRNPLRMSSLYKTKPKNRTPVEEYAEPEETFGVVPLTDMDYNQETLDI